MTRIEQQKATAQKVAAKARKQEALKARQAAVREGSDTGSNAIGQAYVDAAVTPLMHETTNFYGKLPPIAAKLSYGWVVLCISGMAAASTPVWPMAVEPASLSSHATACLTLNGSCFLPFAAVFCAAILCCPVLAVLFVSWVISDEQNALSATLYSCVHLSCTRFRCNRCRRYELLL